MPEVDLRPATWETNLMNPKRHGYWLVGLWLICASAACERRSPALDAAAINSPRAAQEATTETARAVRDQLEQVARRLWTVADRMQDVVLQPAFDIEPNDDINAFAMAKGEGTDKDLMKPTKETDCQSVKASIARRIPCEPRR
jgi:hypothetical protein